MTGEQKKFEIATPIRDHGGHRIPGYGKSGDRHHVPGSVRDRVCILFHAGAAGNKFPGHTDIWRRWLQ